MDAFLTPDMMTQLVALGQVLMIDIALAGDNAIVIGMAVARLPEKDRQRMIAYGLAAAVVLRIIFALMTTQLLQIVGLMIAGGVLLLWVAWKLWREIQEQAHAAAQEAIEVMDGEDDNPDVGGGPISTKQAFWNILIADVSMSLDNVLAVAGAAKDHLHILVIGLLVSIVLMAVAANYIAKMLQKYRWIAYIGLAMIIYVALDMIVHGWGDVAPLLAR